MNKNYLLISVLIVACCFHATAQVRTDSAKLDKIAVGIGAGYDFGGYGGNLILYPQRNIGVFGGVGYTPAGVGYNAGIKLRLVTDNYSSTIVPFVTGMYGYYAIAAPKGYGYFNKIFYGYTVGGGVDYRPNNAKLGYLTATIFVPLRTNAAKYYIDNLNNFQSISYSHKLHAISASIGYKFILFR